MIDPEKRELFLKDESVQVFSPRDFIRGLYAEFNKPIKSIIYINTCQIQKDAKKSGYTEEEGFTYATAHEIGHYFAGEGESLLWEKESNDWLRKYGGGNFDELIRKINYSDAVNEEDGYNDGYGWAEKHEKKPMMDLLEGYSFLWENGNRRDINLHESYIPEIINKIIIIQHGKAEKFIRHCNNEYLKGFAMGVMKRVREMAESHQ